MSHHRACVLALFSFALFNSHSDAQSISPVRNKNEGSSISRILFGSCIKQGKPLPILETVMAKQPELFIFLGDNVYADTTDMDVMRAEYAKLAAKKEFARLMNSCPVVMATWDDHDYGANDAGAEYTKRTEAQEIFSDFWGDAVDSPRRSRPGVYEARVFGPPGRRVQVILLDTRYFRGPLAKGERRVGGPYVPNDDPAITMLGEAQWKWLEQQLRLSAEIRLIASSIQCIPSSSGQETWSNLPRERQRLFDLISQTKASGVIIISGDRHWAELSVSNKATPYPVYELTTSSFNQIHARGTPTENEFRAAPMTYHRENFGSLTIEWDHEDPRLKLEVLDIQGNPQIQKSIALSSLQVR